MTEFYTVFAREIFFPNLGESPLLPPLARLLRLWLDLAVKLGSEKITRTNNTGMTIVICSSCLVRVHNVVVDRADRESHKLTTESHCSCLRLDAATHVLWTKKELHVKARSVIARNSWNKLEQSNYRSIIYSTFVSKRWLVTTFTGVRPWPDLRPIFGLGLGLELETIGLCCAVYVICFNGCL